MQAPVIDPQGPEQREMARRVNVANIAVELLKNLTAGPLAQAKTAEELAEYALTIADKVRGYLDAPIPLGSGVGSGPQLVRN